MAVNDEEIVNFRDRDQLAAGQEEVKAFEDSSSSRSEN
jgi:hypothetical protein